MVTYPNISNLLAAKQARRRTLVALSWEEKVAIIEQMRRLLPRGQWQRSQKTEIAVSHSEVLAHIVGRPQAGQTPEPSVG